MTVGIFHDAYKPTVDGTTTAVEMLCLELERSNHKPFVVAPAFPGYRESEGSRVIRIRSVGLRGYPDYRIALPVPPLDMPRVRKLGLDVIHAQTPIPIPIGTFGVFAARRLRVPLLYTFHTLYAKYVEYFAGGKIITPRRAERCVRLTCNLCDAVIAPSSEMKEVLLSYGVRTRIEVIPAGIDARSFVCQDGSGVFARHRLRRETRVLLFAGRLCAQKNLLFLLGAFKTIAAGFPAVHLFLAGDGVQRRELEEFATHLRIREQVTFLGFLERRRLIEYYRAASVFVMSSLTETQGLVLTEAMLNDTPVVAVGKMGIPSTVTHGIDGLLTTESERDFAEAVLSLLRNDRLREQMAVNAGRSARERSSERTADRIVALYETVRSERRARVTARMN